jgi:hypothetical protein
MNKIPFPVASIVEYEGIKYLVQEISLSTLTYSLIGHKRLRSQGMGISWINESELKPIMVNPSSKTWEMLLQADKEQYEYNTH